MRFRRLTLTFYGHFEPGFALNFGAGSKGAPDLHLVYGPNEAGKSTIFDAIEDFLFGFQRTRSPYQDLHPDEVLRVDAELETYLGVNRYTRLKRNKDALLGDDGATVLGLPLPAGLDRSRFRQMLSLNETSLADGAKEIKSGKGDFGERLFGAAAGVPKLAGRLDELDELAKEIFRPRARSNTKLLTWKEALGALDKRKQDLDIAAPVYAKLEAALAEAREREKCARDARTATMLRLNTLVRRQTAPKLKDKLEAVRETLEALPELPPPPEGWSATLSLLQTAYSQNEALAAEAVRKLASTRQAQAELPEPAAILVFRDRLNDAAFQDLMTKVASAASDIETRRQELACVEDRLKPALAAIGASSLSELSALYELSDDLNALSDRWIDLSHNHKDTEAEAQTLAASGSQTPPSPEAIQALNAAIHTVDASTAPGELDRAEADMQRAARTMNQALLRLAPWRGDASLLAGLPAPTTEQMDGLSQERAAAKSAYDAAALALSAAEKARREREDALRNAERRIHAPGDDDFDALMTARDEAWTTHRASLTAETADAFQARMAAADKAAAARALAHAPLAEARAAAAQLADARLGFERTTEDLKRAKATLDAIDGTAAAWLNRLGLTEDHGAGGLKDWLSLRAEALQAAADFCAAERLHGARAAAVAALQDALLAALSSVEAPPPEETPLSGLVRLAREALDRARDRAKAGERAAEATAKHAEAERQLTAWAAEWNRTISGTTLSGTAPEVGRVKYLQGRAAFADLQNALGLRRQVAGMDADAEALARRVSEMAAKLEMADAMQDPLNTARSLVEQLRAAEALEAARATAAEAVAKAEAEEASLREEARKISAEAAPLLQPFGIPSISEARPVFEDAEARQAKKAEEQTLLEELREIAGAGDIEPLISQIDAAALEADIETANAAYDEADHEYQEASSARRDAERKLRDIGAGNEAALLAQERQSILEDCHAAGARYLELKLGALAVRRGLDRFRADHRSKMLEAASEAFARITRGSFTGLATRPSGGTEDLIGVRANGRPSIPDSAMSTATCGQLYLALRVAGYRDFATAAPPPPFIADDILETFDDMRAEETFGVLGEMAELGQIIYLTHHRHLIDIARKAVPSVHVHELPDPVSA